MPNPYLKKYRKILWQQAKNNTVRSADGYIITEPDDDGDLYEDLVGRTEDVTYVETVN